MPLVSPLPKKLLRRSRWFFLVLGTVLLGYVGYSMLDAKLFQARENERLNQRLNEEMKPSAQLSTADHPLLTALSASSDAPQPSDVIPGSAFGRIEISRIGVDVIIVEGIDSKTLRRAVGHVSGTALPGEPGNVVIAGHRDTFFRALRNIRQDDEISLTTLKGSYRYQVDWTKVVADEATEVLSDSDESILTLVTCYPFYFVGPAPKRFIVRAHKL